MNATAKPAVPNGLQIDVRWLMRELLDEGRVSQEDFNVISTTDHFHWLMQLGDRGSLSSVV